MKNNKNEEIEAKFLECSVNVMTMAEKLKNGIPVSVTNQVVWSSASMRANREGN